MAGPKTSLQVKTDLNAQLLGLAKHANSVNYAIVRKMDELITNAEKFDRAYQQNPDDYQSGTVEKSREMANKYKRLWGAVDVIFTSRFGANNVKPDELDITWDAPPLQPIVESDSDAESSCEEVESWVPRRQ